jgi:hypothetical protein
VRTGKTLKKTEKLASESHVSPSKPVRPKPVRKGKTAKKSPNQIVSDANAVQHTEASVPGEKKRRALARIAEHRRAFAKNLAVPAVPTVSSEVPGAKKLRALARIAEHRRAFAQNLAKSVSAKKVKNKPSEPASKPARPKPVRKPRTAKTTSFKTISVNPYGTNVVMYNMPRPKPPKKSKKVKSISLNQVTFPEPSLIQAPSPTTLPRMLTMDQLAHSDISLNQAIEETKRNVEFLKSAFAARKSAAKKRNTEKKPRSKSKSRSKSKARGTGI